MADQNVTFYIFAKDEASGKFRNAANDITQSMQKVGIATSKVGKGVAFDMDKMAASHDKAGRAARYQGRIISELQAKIGSLRNILLLYFFAMRPIMKEINAITTAAIAQENAERKLAAAFAATGRGTKENIKTLVDYASQLQSTTGISDDAIISAQAYLANFRLNEKQIKLATTAVLDLNAALRRDGDESTDLISTAKILGQAFAGNTGMLERKIGKIDETIKKNRDLNGILKTVKDSVGGTAEAMGKTFEGQVNILKASVDDFNEQLGFIITSSPVVRSAMQMISESFISATENIGAARQETNNFYETWLRVSAGIIGVATAIKAVWKGLLLVFQTVWLVISKILEGLVGMIYSFLGILDFFVQRLPFLSKATKESFASLVEEAKGWVITFENATKETQQNIGVTINSLSNLGTEALNTFGKLEGGAQKFAKSMNESLKGAANPVEELKQKFIATNFIVTQYAISMRDTLRDVLVDGFKTGFKNIGDILANFGDIMLKTIMEAIANMILLKTALAIFGVPLGFSGGASVGGGGISPGSGITATVHSGGYIYAPNAVYGQGRRKFHSGGEVPATLLEGEGVLNRNAMRNMGVNNLDRLNRGEATGGSVVNNYYIQTIDERSFRERLSQHGDIYTSASEQGLRDNHSLRQVSQRYRR